jgi:hypothetical protein
LPAEKDCLRGLYLWRIVSVIPYLLCVFSTGWEKVSKDFQNKLTGGIVLDRDSFLAALTAFDAVVFLSSSDL